MKRAKEQGIKWLAVTAFLLGSCLSAAAKEPQRIYHDGNFDVPPGGLHLEDVNAHPEIQRVLITVHGIFSDAEDTAPKAQNIARESGYDAYLAFEYRRNSWPGFESENDTVYKAGTAKAAVGLAILVGQVHSQTGTAPSIIAHSQGTTILLKAAILAEGLSQLAGGKEPSLSFYGVWDWLSGAEKMTLQTHSSLIQSFTRFDVAITEGTTARYFDPGWGALESRTTGRTRDGAPALFNLHSPIDIANIWLTGAEAGKPTGYVSRLGERNIYVHVPHTGYNLPLVMAIEADLLRDKHLSEETAIELIKHNLAGEPPLESAIEDWRKSGTLPPPPPPPLGPAAAAVSHILLPLQVGSTPTQEMPLDLLSQSLSQIETKVYGTGSSIGLRLAVTNNNAASVSFTLLPGASLTPDAGDVQGMVLAGASVAPPGGFNAAPALALSTQGAQLQNQEASFTVPPLSTVELLLSAVCLNYFRPDGAGVMAPPGEDYAQFTLESPGESSRLTAEKNARVLRVLESIEQVEFKAQEEPVPEGTPLFSVWQAVTLLGRIPLEVTQFAIWAITDDWTYWELKTELEAQDESVNEDIQLMADVVNLILLEAKVPLERGSFLPAFDINWDFEVDIFDLVWVAKYLGETVLFASPHPDVNRDGTVDLFDLIHVAGHLGETYAPQPQAAPPQADGALVNLSKGNGLPGVAGRLSGWLANLPSRFSSQGNGRPAVTGSFGSSSSQEHATVWMEVDLLNQKSFTARIGVDAAGNLIGYQFDLIYDQSLLEVAEVQEGSLLKSDSGQTYFLKPKRFAGKVQVAALRTDKGSVNGEGVLASITFRIKGEDLTLSPASILERLGLTGVKLSDPDGVPIPVLFDRDHLNRRSEISRPLASEIPTQSQLLPNFPNPFNPETWLPYQLATDAQVTIKIYDVTGQLIRVLDLGHKPAGFYHSQERAAHWDGANANGERVASGVYFYRIEAGSLTAVRRMVVKK